MVDLPSAPWRSYIAGEWTAAPDARHYEIVDRGRTGDTVSHYLLATPQEAERAAVAGARSLPGLVDLWQENLEEVAEIVSLEMGKPLAKSRSEAQRAVSELRFWAGEALRIGDRTFPSTCRNSEVATIREPVGPVAASTPWHFPILSLLRKVVPLWSPAAASSSSSPPFRPQGPPCASPLCWTGSACRPAVQPARRRRLRCRRRAGRAPCAGITRTGSTDVGLRIAGDAAARNVRLQLEMDGKNAAVVTSCADVERAAAEISAAAFAVAGQRCTSFSRVVVTPDAREPLGRALVEKAEALRVGHGLDEGTIMGPIVSKGPVRQDPWLRGAGAPRRRPGPDRWLPTARRGLRRRLLLPAHGGHRGRQRQRARARGSLRTHPRGNPGRRLRGSDRRGERDRYGLTAAIF